MDPCSCVWQVLCLVVYSLTCFFLPWRDNETLFHPRSSSGCGKEFPSHQWRRSGLRPQVVLLSIDFYRCRLSLSFHDFRGLIRAQSRCLRWFCGLQLHLFANSCSFCLAWEQWQRRPSLRPTSRSKSMSCSLWSWELLAWFPWSRFHNVQWASCKHKCLWHPEW